MSEIINGKAVAAEIKKCVRERACAFERTSGRKVGLAVVRVGDDPASEIYVRNKVKACEECNIASYSHRMGADTTQDELIELIRTLNNDGSVDGILVQLPLPNHIDERAVLSVISPKKDADGFHAVNAGKLFLGERDGVVACTPRGIIELIKSTGKCIEGKHAVVIGRSNI
ncbi:MAG: bifunctional 5,10-methylene-tetrahydrofolate dehydrogenase/5,10-methylene-tetrahydrofolate cyclohydrolase, partial [Clostridiales bacterium]|nr:bifunctional 5,10-methylene-tetrahydrofolate dehydrogenase/5,10-methylene-tetrahydrofolate cyclohydrolase [Clostridiales bacterium]